MISILAKWCLIVQFTACFLMLQVVNATIFEAVAGGDIEEFNSTLLAQRSDINSFDEDTKRGLLWIAFLNDDLAMFEHLLKLGADPDIKIGLGSKHSIGSKIVEVDLKDQFLLALLRYGMDPNVQISANLSTDETEPILFKTALHMHTINYMIILINSGADIKTTDSEGKNLFRVAVEAENYRAAYYLFVRFKKELFDANTREWWTSRLDDLEALQIGARFKYWKDKLIEEIRGGHSVNRK